MSLFEAAAAVAPQPTEGAVTRPPTQPTPPAQVGPAPPVVVEFTPPQPPLEPSPPPVEEPKATVYDPVKFGEADPKTGRPANVPSKYWDYDKREVKWDAVLVQEQWLQKKVGEKREKPPEKYELTSDADFEAPEGLTDDPVYKGMATFAKETLELSQSQWDGLIRHYWASMAQSGQEISLAQLASLGEGEAGPKRVAAIQRIIAANAPPEIYEKATKGIVNSETVEVLEWALREQLPAKLEHEGAVESGDTEDSLYQAQVAKDEYGQPKMANPEYAAGVRRRRAQYLASKNRR